MCRCWPIVLAWSTTILFVMYSIVLLVLLDMYSAMSVSFYK